MFGRKEDGRTRARWRSPALVFLGVWAITATPLIWAHKNGEAQEAELVRSQTEFLGRVAAKHIRDHVLSRLAVADSLAAEARAMPDLISSALRQRAEGLYAALAGLQAINWVDANARIAWVVPLEINAEALGKSPSESPKAKASFEVARNTGRLQLTPPLTLFQGGIGIAAYLPISVSPREPDLGVINVVFRLDDLGPRLFDTSTMENFHVSLIHEARAFFEYGTWDDRGAAFEMRMPLEIHNARWEISTRPSGKLLEAVRGSSGRGWTWFGLLSTFGIAGLAALYKFTATERERRNLDLERANEILLHATKLVGQETTLEIGAVQELLERCCRAMGVTRAALWSYEEPSDALSLLAMFDKRVERFYAGVKIYTADYPDYWACMRRAGRVVVEDAAVEPATAKLHAERMPHLRKLAMLDVAIRSEERVLGLFSFHRVDAPGAFGPEERLLAQSMADLFALSWERAEKRRAESFVTQRNERLALHSKGMGEIAKLCTSEADLGDVMPRVVQLVAEALGSSRVEYWSLDENGATTRVYDARENEAPFRRVGTLPPSYSAIEHRIASERCVVIDDVAADADYVECFRDRLPELGKVSLLQSGVTSRHRVEGVLCVIERERLVPWYPEDPIFVASVANVVSLHLEVRARREAELALGQQVAALLRHSDALANIAKHWLSETTPSQDLAKVTELAAHALESTSASIWLEAKPGVYRLVERYYAADGRREAGEEIPATLIVDYYRRLANERCVSIVDAASDPTYRGVHAALFENETRVSVLASAVRQKGVPVGVISFLSLGVLRAWTLDEQLFTAALADLVSLGLEQEARLNAERSMRESQRRTNLLVEGTPLAAIDWSTEGRIVGWNAAAERLFGYTRHEALGLPCSVLFPSKWGGDAEDGWLQLRSGVNLVERIPTRPKEGKELICDWRNTLLCDEHGRELGVMSLVEDVTARVESERELHRLTSTLEQRVEARTAELAEANRQLRDLDRLKNEFLATMSHELRTPLNSVIGFSSILKVGMAGPVNEEQGRQLDMINQSARHLLRLINDLLDLSRIEAGHVRLVTTEVDPGGVLTDVERTLRPMIDQKAAHVPFRFDVVNNAVGSVLVTDRTRLLQILINLANNAVKFTSEGSVTVELRAEGDGLVFDVRDTGPGISAENLRHLFEAFRQVDGSARRAYEGTGLGLYLSRKLAHLLGGEVRVTSELGVGSCFSLWLPLRSPTCAS